MIAAGIVLVIASLLMFAVAHNGGRPWLEAVSVLCAAWNAFFLGVNVGKGRT